MIYLILFFVAELVAWFIVHLLCEYKYFWCKGKCDKCYNWKCKFFEVEHKEKRETGIEPVNK